MKVLDALKEEVDRLEQAHALLEEIWLALDPYRKGEIPDKTWDKVKKYFNFDDSE